MFALQTGHIPLMKNLSKDGLRPWSKVRSQDSKPFKEISYC